MEPPYKQWAYRTEELGGVRIVRCPLWVPFNPRGWQRVLSGLIFTIFSFPVMLREMSRRPDIAFVTEPSFLDVVTCLFFAKCFNVPCWLHIQDFEIDIAFELGQFQGGRIRSLVHRFESWVMQRFDVVSTISWQMHARILSKGVDSSKAILFPNWVDTSVIFPLGKENVLRREFGIAPEKVVCLFSGTLGSKQGVELLVDAAAILQEHPEIEFVICGDGGAVKLLKDRANGLRNVRFRPLQPLEQLNELLGMADIHLLPQKPQVADLVMPSKLIKMLASGRPVICSASPATEIANVVSRCGLVVDPEDAPALADAILYLAGNASERIRLGKAARRFAVENLSHESILETFETNLYRCLSAEPEFYTVNSTQ